MQKSINSMTRIEAMMRIFFALFLMFVAVHNPQTHFGVGQAITLGCTETPEFTGSWFCRQPGSRASHQSH